MNTDTSKTIIRHLKGIVAALEKDLPLKKEQLKKKQQVLKDQRVLPCQGDCSKTTLHKEKIIKATTGIFEVYECVECGSQLDKVLADFHL